MKQFIAHQWLLSATAALALTLPASALDVNSMSDIERDAFQQEVRRYLLENPEIIIEAIGLLEERQAQDQAQADIDLVRANKDALFNDANSWSGGNLDGDITLVEFVDYRCGYCRRAAPELQSFLNTDTNVRIIVKEFPILGDASLISSRFAIATRQLAGDNAYKSVHDALLAMNGDVNSRSLKRLGRSLDLPTDDIIAHMDSHEVTAVIAANHQLAQKLNISGTPTFVIGEQMVRGFIDADQLQQISNDMRSK
ncbi:MAG: DsbA family protein [Pseudomonadota bacterium]